VQRSLIRSISAPSESQPIEAVNRGSFLRLLWNGAGIEQVGQVGGVGCIKPIWPQVKDFLHGAQIGRMRIIPRHALYALRLVASRVFRSLLDSLGGTMPIEKSDLLQGTLDMLIFK
jgi:hypothetical protein